MKNDEEFCAGLGETPDDLNRLENEDDDLAFLDTDDGLLERLPAHLLLAGE